MLKRRLEAVRENNDLLFCVIFFGGVAINRYRARMAPPTQGLMTSIDLP